MSRLRLLVNLLTITTIFLRSVVAKDVTTNRNDNLRTGWYPDEGKWLTPDVVRSDSFGLLWQVPVFGQLYGQMLTYKGILIGATEKNRVYGINAYTGEIIWTRQWGNYFNPLTLDPAILEWGGVCDDLTPAIGTTSTPVIDPDTDTVYLTNKEYVSGWEGETIYYVRALDVFTGEDRAPFPVEIKGNAINGGLEFLNNHHHQRSGLLLMDGVVYIAMGAHCDAMPWQGWVMGVTAVGHGREAGKWTCAWTSNPIPAPPLEWHGGGIWHAGSGLMSDEPGYITAMTGNGFPVNSPLDQARDRDNPFYAMMNAIIRLKVDQDLNITLDDFFQPQQLMLDSVYDLDMGSGGPVGLPKGFGANLTAAIGKNGYFYLLDRHNFGGYHPEGDKTYGKLSDAFSYNYGSSGVWGPTTNGQGYIYLTTNDQPLNVLTNYTTADGKVAFRRAGRWGSPDNAGWGTSTPVISSDGNIAESGVVWTARTNDRSSYGSELRAYRAIPDPQTGELELLWMYGPYFATRYHSQTISNGRVYTSALNPVDQSDGIILVFGTPNSPFPPVPTLDPLAPSPTPLQKWALYLDCGGPGGLTDDLGHVWQPDRYYTPSNVAATQGEIARAVWGATSIFSNGRWGGAGIPLTLTYTVPVPVPGIYNVTYFGVEQYFREAGARVLNLVLQSKLVDAGLDLFELGGGYNSLVTRTFLARVEADWLFVELSVIASNSDPYINGLVIQYVRPLPPTPTFDPHAPTPTRLPPWSLFIDCGSTAGYTDSAGHRWVADADNFRNGGNVGTVSLPVANALWGATRVFQTSRWGNGDDGLPLAYFLPVPRPGDYTITFYLVEPYHQFAGLRLLSLYVQGELQEANIDAFLESGGFNRLVIKSYLTTITDDDDLTITASIVGVGDLPTIAGLSIELYVPPLVDEDQPTPTPLPEVLSYELYIDCGGPGLVQPDDQGHIWSADQYFNGGSIAAYNGDPVIGGLWGVDAIWATSRWMPAAELTYRIPVPYPGVYDTILFFTEPYWQSAMARTTIVQIQGRTVIPNLDIYQQSGGYQSLLTLTFPADVQPNSRFITVDLIPTNNDPTITGVAVVYTGPLPPRKPFGLYIDCGYEGTPQQDADGLRSWVSDVDYVNGGPIGALQGVVDNLPTWAFGVQNVFQTARWGGIAGQLRYSIPVDKVGLYSVSIYMTEQYYQFPGGRLQSVSINGITLLTDIDVFALSRGFNSLYTSSFNIAVTSPPTQIIIVITASAGDPSINAISVEETVAPSPTRSPTPTRRPTRTPSHTRPPTQTPLPTPGPSPTRTPTSSPTPIYAPGELDPNSVPQFVNELPHALDPSFIFTESDTDLYEIGIYQTWQNVLGPNFNDTRIYGYGNAADLTNQGPTWPGRTFNLRANHVTRVTWINNLVDEEGNELSHFLPIDPTVMWADPLGLGSGAPVPVQGPVPTVVHVHGVVTDEHSDGGAMSWFTPGYKHKGPHFGSATSVYPNEQEAGNPWYHDHALGITRLNVYAGLAGFWLLRDDRDTGLATNPLGLPASPYEVPFVIQDRRFDTSHQLLFPSDPPTDQSPAVSILPDFFGRIICVNGKAWPSLEVERRVYRFRVINGCDSRILALQLAEGAMVQIGVDAGFLNTAVTFAPGQPIVLSPGERADILIDFKQWDLGSTVLLTNTRNWEDGTATIPSLDGSVLQFRIAKPLSAVPDTAIRASYRDAPFSIQITPLQVRSVGLFESTDDFGRRKFELGKKDALYAYEDPITEVVVAGSSEIWDIWNFGGMVHPIHLHVTGFVVVGRYPTSGTPADLVAPQPNELGPKDTVMALPTTVTRIHPHFLNYTGIFTWHCHILSHEDYDMMRPYRIVSPDDIAEALIPTLPPTVTPGPPPVNAPVLITQIGVHFVPNYTRISPGMTVRWFFTEPLGHTLAQVPSATSRTPLKYSWDDSPQNFFRGRYDPDTFDVTFTDPGFYYYICQPHIHLNMRGTIEVVADTPTPVPTRRRNVQATATRLPSHSPFRSYTAIPTPSEIAPSPLPDYNATTTDLPSLAPTPTDLPTHPPSLAPTPTDLPTHPPSIAPTPTDLPTHPPSMVPTPTVLSTTMLLPSLTTTLSPAPLHTSPLINTTPLPSSVAPTNIAIPTTTHYWNTPTAPAPTVKPSVTSAVTARPSPTLLVVGNTYLVSANQRDYSLRTNQKNPLVLNCSRGGVITRFNRALYGTLRTTCRYRNETQIIDFLTRSYRNRKSFILFVTPQNLRLNMALLPCGPIRALSIQAECTIKSPSVIQPKGRAAVPRGKAPQQWQNQ